jgi:hypothetical protein
MKKDFLQLFDLKLFSDLICKTYFYDVKIANL